VLEPWQVGECENEAGQDSRRFVSDNLTIQNVSSKNCRNCASCLNFERINREAYARFQHEAGSCGNFDQDIYTML
jgi:hypothetical protein